MRHETRTPPPARRHEAGSAYLIVLLVLVVLTILGLTLALVTSNEMEIGANERIIQRTFFEAETGVAFATARVLVNNDHRPVVIDLEEPGGLLAVGTRTRLDLAPVVPLSDSPCNLCEINNAGTYNERAFRKVNNVITSRATRLGAEGTRFGTARVVSSMLEIQPWKSTPESYAAIGDKEQLAKVRF